MIKWNNFYGAIFIDRDYQSSKKFIAEEMLDKQYQYFHPSIFSLPIQEYPYYYDNILLTFGRTAKNFVENGYELQKFIYEFEDILSNLDFRNAQVNIDSNYAIYNLFWINRQKLQKRHQSDNLNTTLKYFKENEIRIFETEKFYFGLGEIDLFTGWVEEKYNSEKLIDFDLQYPSFKYHI